MANLNFENIPYNIIVKLSDDYYNAYITVEIFDETVKLVKEALYEALNLKKVVFGINPNAIDAIVKNPNNVEMVEVATGIKHKNGLDSKVIYKVDINMALKPKLKEDGTVDYKNIDYAHTVKKGQILAEKTLITLGENGTTVTGMIIKAKDGKMSNFKFGRNVALSEDEMSIFSTVDGNLKVEGYKLSVVEVLEIFSDVGIKTGNIKFTGKIIVRGNVTSGYKVETQDSIEVYGVIESAAILAGEHITINGGVQGNDKCIIQAGGDIKSNYFNNCKVISGGDVVVNSIMHCDVVCDGSIIAKGKKGLIVGGSCFARHHIKAKTIGAEIGTITKLQLGITGEILEEFQSLAEQVKVNKESIKKLNKALSILNNQKKVKPEDLKIAMLYDNTLTTLNQYNSTLKATTQKFKVINNLVDSLKNVSVSADEINIGVRIRMDHSHYNVKKPLNMVKMIKEHGEIILKPL